MEKETTACELCGTTGTLTPYAVAGLPDSVESVIDVCRYCADQLTGVEDMNVNHWRCLNTSMWSTSPAVQVMAWRLLNSLRDEGWPQDLLDTLYLEEDVLGWAKASPFGNGSAVTDDGIVHKDSNGTILQEGDSVLLIKDLDVKGGGFKAKRGTLVRNISLVDNNPEQIEGKVSGQQIVILTKFVKKA